MRTRKSTRALNGRSRRGVTASGSRDDCWRTETLPDGARVVALAGALSATAAQELLRELCDDRWQRLVVDLRAAEPLREDAPALLAAIFLERVPRAEIVVVCSRRSALAGLLPTSVAIASSLEDARHLLAIKARRRTVHRASRADSDVISAVNRHALAVRQGLRWAAQAAAGGDYEAALRSLDTLERVEGTLTPDWQERRRAWQTAASASPGDHAADEQS
jgi:hypothetical protein